MVDRKGGYGGMRYAGLGLELAGAVAGLTLLGYWLDGRWGTAPWLMLAGLAIGLLGGTYNLLRETLGETRRSARREPPGDDGP